MTDNKIIKRRFRSSIKRGTGEAHLIMQNNPTVDFSSDIIKASLKNYAYDGQSEGSRVLYISELIGLSKQQDKIRQAILIGLATERSDTWALVQLFDLATVFAKQGHKDAKRAIYKRFFKKIINGSDWCGYDSIIALDGLDGLKYIASTIGKTLVKNPGDWQDDMIIRHFQDENPNLDAKKELEKASIDDKYIRIYLDNIQRTEAKRENYQPPVFNLDTLRERIENSKFIYIPPSFTKSLSDKEKEIIADELLAEKDKLRIGKYLSIFSRIKFPYDYKVLLKYAKTRVNNNNRIAEWAVESLKFFSGDDIRQFALDKLKSTKSPSTFTKLLINNYRQGDSVLLKSIADKCKSDNSVHNLVYSYVDIFKVNKTKDCKEPLEAIYDKLTCGIHRADIIRILIENNVLSSQIESEIKYDCSEETRGIKK